MAKLVYSATISLDGYVADEAGNIDWADLDEGVGRFVNEREAENGTYLFGRRMYETMAVWETPEALPPMDPAFMEFVTLWRRADKIVYSTTLDKITTANTRLERTFDPNAVRDLKARSTRNLSIGGPTLAAHAIRAGLVDEYNVFVAPVILGGGNPYLHGGVRVKLELFDERKFNNGLVHLRYRTKS